MLNMKEKAIIVFISALAAVITAGLIRATWTYDVELVSSPSGPVVAAPASRPFNISCRLSGGDANNISSMKWLGPEEKDVAGGNAGVVKSENNVLLLNFTNPKPEDSGIYKCAATYADHYNLVHAVQIVFYGPSPTFEVTYENTTVTEGESVELHCFAMGELPMMYMWYDQAGNYIPEDPDRSVSVSRSSNESWLHIREVKSLQEGMYSCNANNSHGLASKLYHLNVSPRRGHNETDNDIVVTPDFKFVDVSANSVRLQIPASGKIEVIYWESRETAQIRKEFPPDADNLYSIENLIPAGNYTFQYRNVSSEEDSKWSQKLQVTLLPDVPEIIVRRQEKGSLEIEWFRKVDDIMRGTIDKYEIKYYSVAMQGGNEWVPRDCATIIQIPYCRGASHIIAGLWEKAYYVIELRAHTASGYGETAKLKIYVSA